jgi:ABC-2 type transport system ATP-binding protein
VTRTPPVLALDAAALDADIAADASHDAAIVEVRDVAKGFPVRRGWRDLARHPFRRDRTPSLRGVSFEIRAGEFFGLLGPNGAGKTTLLKILATLILPDAGEVTIGGFDAIGDPGAVRRLVVPVTANERSLYWRLSATENLELFAALFRIPPAEARRRIAEVLGVVGLADVGSKLVGQMSSGMMQRMLIARALLAGPRVLLLDEPTRSLDPISAREFRRFLREELAGRRGCAVLLATHSAEEAFDLCDRVGVLSRGRLLAVGPTDELARQFSGSGYRFWTRTTDAALLGRVLATAGARIVGTPMTTTEGWTRVDVEVPGGLDGAARAIAALTGAGVIVGTFEKAPVSLADLIERVVAEHGGTDSAGGR